MCLIEMGMPKMGPDRKPELGADGKPVINWMPRPQISCAQDVSRRNGRPHRLAAGRGVPQGRDGISCSSITRSIARSAIRPASAACRNSASSTATPTRASSNTRSRNRRTSSSVRASRSTTSAAFFARAAFASEGDRERRRARLRRSRQLTPFCTAHPGKRLENNYSLNTVDICPVGALTSTDFRFKMRVWFLEGNQEHLHELRAPAATPSSALAKM